MDREFPEFFKTPLTSISRLFFKASRSLWTKAQVLLSGAVIYQILIFRGKFEICNPNKSVGASSLYKDLRYETFTECENPCTKMNVASHFKLKSSTVQYHGRKYLNIRFPAKVELSVETVQKSLFSAGKIN